MPSTGTVLTESLLRRELARRDRTLINSKGCNTTLQKNTVNLHHTTALESKLTSYDAGTCLAGTSRHVTINGGPEREGVKTAAG